MARVTVRRVLLLAVLVGVLFDLVVPGHAPGLNVLVVTAVLLLVAVAVADPAGLRRFDPWTHGCRSRPSCWRRWPRSAPTRGS